MGRVPISRPGSVLLALGLLGTATVLSIVVPIIAVTLHHSAPLTVYQRPWIQPHSAVTHSAPGSTSIARYRPGTYPVNETMTSSALGSLVLETITVNGDGTVAAKLSILSTIAAEPTCAFSTAGEATLQTSDGTIDPAMGSDCSNTASKTWVEGPGRTWSNTEYFAHAPAGHGSWSLAFNTRLVKGSVSDITIPTS